MARRKHRWGVFVDEEIEDKEVLLSDISRTL